LADRPPGHGSAFYFGYSGCGCAHLNG
jgi:hypothetical protein